MAQKKAKEPKRPKGKFSLERMPTGIPGLDGLIRGGFIKGSTNLITGTTGTGKTIFCVQFLLDGLKRGEKCLFLTFEEKPEDIIEDVRAFGWDIGKYVENGQLTLQYRDPFELTDSSKITQEIRSRNISRLAIDSTSALGLYFKDAFDVRKYLFKLLSAVKGSGATTVLTTEMPEADGKLSRFGVEEYVTEGVIVLHYLGLGGSVYHSLQIRKMRRTDHGKDVYPMDITDKGIVLRKI